MKKEKKGSMKKTKKDKKAEKDIVNATETAS